MCKIIAKKQKCVKDFYWKKSIKMGLNELREQYLNTSEVTVIGNKNIITFITKNDEFIDHIKTVLNNYAIPYNVLIDVE